MAKLTRTTISRRTVDRLEADRDTVFWDSELPGFGVRVYPTGRKVYVVQTRTGGRSGKRVTVGRHGVVTPEEARRRAALIVARIKAGEDPVPEPLAVKEAKGPTVSDLAAVYLREVVDVRLKEATAKSYRHVIGKHILPAFGSWPALALDHAAVSAFHHGLAATPSAANRALEILRAMMFRAEEWGRREPGTNPCLGIRHNPKRSIARFLDTDELARLGRALDAREAEWPEAVNAIRLLALTGCRRSEVLNLRWRDIGKDAINLSDSKTGPRAVPLGEAARAHIEALPGGRDPDAYLFPRYAGKRTPHALVERWRATCAEAGLGRLRLHDLRHTAASQAVMSGEGLSQVGKLLGHRRHRTTAGYAHLADAHLVEAAEKVGGLIAEAMVTNGTMGCKWGPQ